MESREFVKLLKQYLDDIYNNFNRVFGINYDEFSMMMKKIIKDLFDDNFYNNILVNNNLILSFNEKSLFRIKEYFLSFDIDEDKIKNVILTLPEIVLFSQLLDKVFLIYKSNNFKGIVLVNDNEYRSYSYSNSSYDLRYLNGIVDNNDVNNYNYLVSQMLNSLDREDINKSLNFKLDEETSLIRKMDALVKDYSKKNYYFKKKK